MSKPIPSNKEPDTEVDTLFNPILLIFLVILSCIGAMIGIQIITTLGISANTSIIGAVLAILFSRLPFASFLIFKRLGTQNLVQTAISSATFSAANGLLISIGVPWALGMPELVWPMLIGASIAVLIDGTMLYGAYNTKAFPASAPWPAGVATAETLWAGDQGGKKLWGLLAGFGVGIGGAFYGIPMASAGIAFIGSFLALFSFAIGLLVRGFSAQGTIPFDLYANYVPHGFMVGAGLVALYQIIRIISQNKKLGFNSIMQPHVATSAPVVGLAITAKSVVPGCDTGASYESELVDATRYTVEVAKQFTWNKISFYDSAEYEALLTMYGKLDFLQKNS